MKLTGIVRLNSQIREVKQQGNGFAMEFAEIMGEAVTEKAKRNTKPGAGLQGIGGGGPGPHPHRTPHYDTGRLSDSLRTRTRQRGFMFEALTETDVDYGLYLEAGWTAASGVFYRYPWLYPAASEASLEWQPIARSTAAHWFRDDGPRTML